MAGLTGGPTGASGVVAVGHWNPVNDEFKPNVGLDYPKQFETGVYCLRREGGGTYNNRRVMVSVDAANTKEPGKATVTTDSSNNGCPEEGEVTVDTFAAGAPSNDVAFQVLVY
ncbi:MAG TPA: hypothetical protein VGW98_12525 [Solirubrobacteraceae bacterium]|nr:hypothetical protein [Solirubrobacteraceae bacterium]